MKLAVVGSRGFDNYELLCWQLADYKEITTIVSGGAKGADSLARKYAEEKGIEIIEFLPDWGLYGKSAGFRRNADIVNACDMLIAFWDGFSKGTKHSIDLARKMGKEVRVVNYKNNVKGRIVDVQR